MDIDHITTLTASGESETLGVQRDDRNAPRSNSDRVRLP